MSGLCGQIFFAGKFKPGWLTWSGGRIAEIGLGKAPRRLADKIKDLGRTRIAPGYVDTLCHGFAGIAAPNAKPDELARMARALSGSGVTTVLSGFYPTGNPSLRAAAKRWDKYKKIGRRSSLTRTAARLEGWHVEGPFIGSEMAGALPLSSLRLPTSSGMAAFVKACDGNLRMTTFAPELAGAEQLVAYLVKHKVWPSIGHTCCRLDECQQVSAAADTKIAMTHLFNRMRATSRGSAGGPIQFAELALAKWIGIIPDGVHVPVTTLAAWSQRKAFNNCLMYQSDNLSHAGLAAESFMVGGLQLRREGPSARRPDGGLGGSLDSLSAMLHQRITDRSINLARAIQGACVVPGSLFGDRGVLVPGKLADINALSSKGEVLATWIGGKPVPKYQSFTC